MIIMKSGVRSYICDLRPWGFRRIIPLPWYWLRRANDNNNLQPRTTKTKEKKDLYFC